jgi:hypothetical protein
MPQCSITSITPKVATIRGGTRITIRGRGFSSSSLKISFTSHDGTQTLDGIAASCMTDKSCEVTSPNCSSLRRGDKSWVFVTLTCGGKPAAGRRKLRLEQTCTIVRKCMQVDGHAGRCCSDPPPPMYGSYAAPETPGGKIGTALLGYRLKDKHKPNSLPGPRPPPERKEIPGGVIARTPRKCATGPIGGIDDSRLREAKASTAQILLLPGFADVDMPGGRFNVGGSRKKKTQNLTASCPEGPGPGGSGEMFGGCGTKLTPGGRFNLSGSKKKMFRQTYLDYA